MAHASPVDADRGHAAPQLEGQADAVVLGRAAERLGSVHDQRLGRDLHAFEPGLAGGHAADVEKIGQYLVQAVAVLARGDEELGLLGGQAPHFFFQKKMDGHADRGQGGL